MGPIKVVGAEETRRDIDVLLNELGMALDELREEARTGEFRSEDAALAWFAISQPCRRVTYSPPKPKAPR